MALVVYGSPRSRTMRVLWTATELGLTFEHVPLEWNDPALKQPAFLALNPAGAIPTIVDDGFALSESMAINLYLAKKYGGGAAAPLFPATSAVEARIWQWSLWAQGHLEPWVQKDAGLADLTRAIGDRGDAVVRRALTVLDGVLSATEWLTADHFTIGDLNVAAVLSPSRARSLDFTGLGRVADWLERCYSRPACIAARARYSAA